MEFGQALEVVQLAFTQKIGRPLTAAEEALLNGAWNKLTYDRIAARSGYTLNYLQRCKLKAVLVSLTIALCLPKPSHATLRATLKF
jgi:hypothetical protein